GQVTLSGMAKRWCVVEQDEQQDLFVGDPWHVHLVDINLRLDAPLERSLCGDLLPSHPVYRELQRQSLRSLCPQCVDVARTMRAAGRRSAARPGTGTVAETQPQELDAERGSPGEASAAMAGGVGNGCAVVRRSGGGLSAGHARAATGG